MKQFAAIIQPASRRRLRQLNPGVAKPRPILPGLRNLVIRLFCGHTPTWPVYLAVDAVAWLFVGPFVAAAILGYVWMAHRAGRSAVRRAAAAAAGRACGIAFAGIADELRAGRSADAALFTGIQHIENVAVQGICAECARHAAGEWQAVRLAIPRGESAVTAALRTVSRPSGVWARQLAAAWSLTGSGAALGEVLDSLERELATTRETERARAVHTAASRATVLVLTGLPAIGIVLGFVIGADPIGLLLRTPLGTGCLLIATGLQLIGWYWADRITGSGRDISDVGATPTGCSTERRWPKPGRLSQVRLRSAIPQDYPQPTQAVSARRQNPQVAVRWSVAGLSGAMAAWCLGGVLALPTGVLLTLVVGVVLSRVSRSHPPDPRWEAHFPYALSLTAALLRAGATTPHALSAVGRALPGPAGSAFLATGAALRGGQLPGSVWPETQANGDAVGSLLRSLDRTSHSGAALAGVCERLAEQLRRDSAAKSAVHAQRAGVVMVAPLMCCFLPAFVLLGVVPVVADVLHQTLSHG